MEHELADGVAHDADGVERAAHFGQRAAAFHKRRRNVQFERVAIQLGDGQQLDAVAEFLGEADIALIERSMPMRGMSFQSTRAPKARWARIASFWAASLPSTSIVGSASA